jgi:hypothetical protein
MFEERSGCLQKKAREVVMEENVARYGALFPGKCGPGFVKAFSAACRQLGCLVTVHECIMCVSTLSRN